MDKFAREFAALWYDYCLTFQYFAAGGCCTMQMRNQCDIVLMWECRFTRSRKAYWEAFGTYFAKQEEFVKHFLIQQQKRSMRLWFTMHMQRHKMRCISVELSHPCQSSQSSSMRSEQYWQQLFAIFTFFL